MSVAAVQGSRPERRGTPSLEEAADRTRRNGTPPSVSSRPIRDTRSPVNKPDASNGSSLVPKQLGSLSASSLASSADTGRSSPSTGRGAGGGRGRGRPPGSTKNTASRRSNMATSSASSPLTPTSDDFSCDDSPRSMTPKVLRQRVRQLKRVARREMREMLQFHKTQAAASATDPELAAVLKNSTKTISDLKAWLDTLESYEEQYKGLWSSGKSSTASSAGSSDS